MSETQPALTFLGCGDAFGSGGRLHTCMHLATASQRVLIDCGASALIGMRRCGVDPLGIDAVVITHFHADHFAGLAFLIIESKLRKRTQPLVIAGPQGIAARLDANLDVLFPGSRRDWPFGVSFEEYAPGRSLGIGEVNVDAMPVVHTPETRPHGLRLRTGERTLAFSGDTEWTDALVDLAADADLFVCEASTLERTIPNHVSYATLQRNRDRLACRRLVLTHMGADTLAAADRIAAEGLAEMAEDGLRTSI